MMNVIETMKNIVHFLWWLFLILILLYMIGVTVSETMKKLKDKWR